MAIAHRARRFFANAEHPEYLIPGHAEVVVASILLAMAIAAGVGFLTKRGLATTFSALATLLIFGGFLLALLGIPLFALGALAVLAAVRALKDSTRVRGGLAVGAGIVLALGFAFVMIVGAHPPLVECENDQVTISDTYWFWPGSPNRGSGSGTMSPDGTNWGTVTSRGKTYSYVCGQDELVSFRRVD